MIGYFTLLLLLLLILDVQSRVCRVSDGRRVDHLGIIGKDVATVPNMADLSYSPSYLTDINTDSSNELQSSRYLNVESTVQGSMIHSYRASNIGKLSESPKGLQMVVACCHSAMELEVYPSHIPRCAKMMELS